MQRYRGDSRRISARETEKGKGREHNVGNKRSEERKQTRCSTSQPASSQRRSSEHVSSSWSSVAAAKNNEGGRGDERRSRHHSFDRKAKRGNQGESYVANEIKELKQIRSIKRSFGNERGCAIERSQQKRGHGSSHNRKERVLERSQQERGHGSSHGNEEHVLERSR